MKKTFTKIAALLLSIALIAQISLCVFAGTVTFMVGGVQHTASVTASGTTFQKKNVPGTQNYHSYGSATTITVGTTYMSFTKTASWTPDYNQYHDGVKAAINNTAGTSYQKTFSSYVSGSVTIPAASPSGNYYAAVRAYGITGTFRITKQVSGNPQFVQSGTVTYSPTTCDFYTLVASNP